MVGNPIIINEVYNCSIKKLWNALTNPDALNDWYFDLKDFRLEEGAEFEFYGGKYLHHCKIVEIVLYRKLAYTWEYPLYEGNSLVTFDLSAIDEEYAQLQVTHEGIASFPTDDVNFSRNSFEAGWNELIRIALKAYVEFD